MRGVSPLKGGKDHTTHALSYAGWSDRTVNLLFFLWSALNAFLAFYVIKSEALSKFEVTVLVLYILITFALLFANAYRKEEKIWSE